MLTEKEEIKWGVAKIVVNDEIVDEYGSEYQYRCCSINGRYWKDRNCGVDSYPSRWKVAMLR